jgi:ankyrin repeat protein
LCFSDDSESDEEWSDEEKEDSDHTETEEIYLACQRGDLKALRHWMNGYTQEEIPLDDSFGKFPIHYAAEKGHAAIIDYLADQYGYNVNQKTVPTFNTEVEEEKTALHFAVENNHSEVVRVLLKHGANVFEIDQNKKTPVDVAEEKGFLKLLKILQLSHSEKG